MIRLTKNEVRDLIIAFIILAIANVRFNIHEFLSILPIVMAGAGLGFLLREIGHKYAAMQYDYSAEFEMWPLGLVVALASAFKGEVFAAPGKIIFHPEP